MTTHPNLATALAAFQAEMPTVAKSKRADVPTKTGGKYSYTYADLADVTAVAMPVLARHGLSFVTMPRSGAQGLELRGVLLHKSGESVKGALPIRGNTPQEIGSSLTYMRRYLLGCLTGVVTEDDDDAAAAQAAGRRKPQAEPPSSDEPQGPTRRMSRASTDGPEMVTKAQSAALHASFNGAGIIERAARLAYCLNLIDRDIASSSELTRAEASRCIDALHQDAQDTEPGEAS